MFSALASLLAAAATAVVPAPAATAPSPATCATDWLADRMPSSMGDPAMREAMDRLRQAYVQAHPGTGKPTAWQHASQDKAMGTLMFELADMAPITREFSAAEIAPYEHQYRGDMIRQPFMVRIGTLNGQPAMIAVNRRPDSPLPERILAFLRFALDRQGQEVLKSVASFEPLAPEAATAEARRLDAGYLAPLDRGLPTYQPVTGLHGTISSVGSDGMKDLVDGWECRFAALQPGVRKGERWEHFGTLNGFHALMAGQADIAPMGRELWPQERKAWAEATGAPDPVEIAVARGGFDTPQRTTAQAIFVHGDNPLKSIGMAQLADVLGSNPTITRWGQLGLQGEWAEQPIHVLMPPRVTPNAMSVQINLLRDREWNAAAKEAPYAETARNLANDPLGIAFGGLEEGLPQLRAIAVSGADGVPVALDGPNAASGRYPLTRLMYIRLAPGRPSAQVTAFLRYVLSREGQERVRYSGYYPLTAREAAAELEKLKQLAR